MLYYTLFRPSMRAGSLPYLEKRFPGRSPLMRLADSYRLSLAAGKVLVDRAVYGILGPKSVPMGSTGLQKLAGLVAEGRGLVLVTAHVGGWQLAMDRLRGLQTTVNLLMHRAEGDLDRHFFEHRGESSPYRIIDPADYLGGTLQMLQALKQGEVVCIMGDRVMGGESGTVGIDFLGHQVRLPFSPYKLASASGAPVAVILPYRTAEGGYALLIPRVFDVPKELGRASSAYLPYAREFVSALEEFVEQYPYQFFNFFDMWAPLSSGGQTGNAKTE